MKKEENDYTPRETSFEDLQAKLREDLDDRFSDGLIKTIVHDFLDNETLRLKASEYRVQAVSLISIEYRETIFDLNAHAALLSRWAKSTPKEYAEKVGNLISEYDSALDTIITVPSPFYLYHGAHEDKDGNPIQIEVKRNSAHLQVIQNQPPYYLQITSNSDGTIKNYPGPWPSKYCFYYSALLVLLRSSSKNETKKKGNKGKVDELGLNIADYATILFYATIAGYYLTDNIEAERAKFIKKHNVPTDTVNFRSAISDIQDSKRRRVPGRMKRIKEILEEHYPNAVERMVKEIKII